MPLNIIIINLNTKFISSLEGIIHKILKEPKQLIYNLNISNIEDNLNYINHRILIDDLMYLIKKDITIVLVIEINRDYTKNSIQLDIRCHKDNTQQIIENHLFKHRMLIIRINLIDINSN